MLSLLLICLLLTLNKDEWAWPLIAVMWVEAIIELHLFVF